MWKIAFKQILSHRKSNRWLLLELFLVSIILWYCVDFLFVMTYKRLEPMGTNTDHVYELYVERAPDFRFTGGMRDSLDIYWIEPQLQIHRVIAQHPDVESASYYVGTRPFAGKMYMGQGYTIDGEHGVEATIRYVGKEYFDVMKVEMLAGAPEMWTISSPQGAVLSPQLADSLFHSQDIIGREFKDYYSPELSYVVSGICAPTKFDYFAQYGSFIYTPLTDVRIRYSIVTYVFRVKSERDHKGFAREFFNEMRDKLEIGPFYLTDVRPLSAQRDYYLTNINVPQYLSLIQGLVIFFMFIVFLGVLGSYWFMVERRRGEIGVRIALGTSRSGIQGVFARESLLMLLMAYLPALVVMILLAYFEITYTFQECMPYTWGRFWGTQGITFAVLLLVVLLGILVPARRASKLDPAIILNEE